MFLELYHTFLTKLRATPEISLVQRQAEQQKTEEDQVQAEEQPGQTPMQALREKRGGGTYTVRGGDSYAKIAKQVYGSETYTKFLQQANAGKTNLRPGNELSTPETWVPAQLSSTAIGQIGVTTTLTEGSEGSFDPTSPYYVLKFHVPSEQSGITLGQGYDLKERKQSAVESDLLRISVNAKQAKLISSGVGKRGAEARKFIKEKGLQGFMITEEQAKNLFSTEFSIQFNETLRRIAQEIEPGLTFETLDNRILETLTDLKYRGDLTPKTWKILREAVKANDVEQLKEQMSRKRNWVGVPYDRYKRRCEHLGGTPEPEAKAKVKEKPSEKISVQRAAEVESKQGSGTAKVTSANQTTNPKDIVRLLQEIEQEINFNKIQAKLPNLSQSERDTLDQNLLELEAQKAEQWSAFTAKQPSTNREYASWLLKAGELGFVDHTYGSKEQLEQLNENKQVGGIDPVSERITALITMYAIVQAAVKRWVAAGMPIGKPAVTLGSFIRPRDRQRSPHKKGEAIDINKLYLTGKTSIPLGSVADVIQMLKDLPPGKYELGLPPQDDFFKPEDLLQIPSPEQDPDYSEKRGPKEGRKEKAMAQYEKDKAQQPAATLPHSSSAQEPNQQAPPQTTTPVAPSSALAAKASLLPTSIKEQSYKFWDPRIFTSSWNEEEQKWVDTDSNDVYILLKSEEIKKQIREMRQKAGYSLRVIPDYLRHFHVARS